MKRKYYRLLPFFFLVLILSACAGGRAASSGKKSGGGNDQPVAEDLSMYRPKFTLAEAGTGKAPEKPAMAGIKPENHVNAKVTALMDMLTNRNRAYRYTSGYRILAYSGTQRKAWLDMRDAIVKRVPEERDYPVYTQPTYRLKIGDYFTRIEAQQVLLRIKDISPNAMIIADQINVK